MKEEEELNYKEAYYYLFNQVTDMMEQLKNIQIQAEELCTKDE